MKNEEITKRDHDFLQLKGLIKRIKNGTLAKKELLHHRRLSYKKTNLKLSENCIKSNPDIFSLFCELKFLVEEYKPDKTLAELNNKYASLIQEIRKTIQAGDTTSDLSLKNNELYQRAIQCPHWPQVKYLAFNRTSKPEYYYWTNSDLVEKTGQYKNFTDLKNRAGQLHRQIKGRRLEKDVVNRWPHYHTNTYIGINGHIYRSQGELVFGNFIELSNLQEDWERQVTTGIYRKDSNKPMVADFYCKQPNLFIEISMFEENGRGSRGKQYEKRRKEKQRLYDKFNLNALFIDSSNFYINGCIDAKSFANYCIQKLHESGYKRFVGKEFNTNQIFHHESIDCNLDLSPNDFLDYLEKEHGLTNKAQLSNDKSYLNKIINLRPGSDKVNELLLERGEKIRRRKIHDTRSKIEYAPLEEIREYIQENGITTQAQWWVHAKQNKASLKTLKIPTNLPDVYGRRNQWRGWGHLFHKD